MSRPREAVSGVRGPEPLETFREHRAELRPAGQRDHERGVDPGRIDREAFLEQPRIVIAVSLERDAGCVVLSYPCGEGKCREIELTRAAARRLEVVPERPRQAVGEVRVTV